MIIMMMMIIIMMIMMINDDDVMKVSSQPQSVLVGPDELSMWGDLGERMVVLAGDTEQHMKDLELMAKNLRLPCHMIDIPQVILTMTDVRNL